MRLRGSGSSAPKFAVLAALVLAACSSAVAPESRVVEARSGEPIYFAFGTTEGKEWNSEMTRGRVTAVLFVTTFDLASQLEARRLNDVLRTHSPRINAGAVVLEAPKYATFAEVFRTSLGLTYPVAIADGGTLAGEGPFGALSGVPTLVVLDRSGRETARRVGLQSAAQIESAVSDAQK